MTIHNAFQGLTQGVVSVIKAGKFSTLAVAVLAVAACDNGGGKTTTISQTEQVNIKPNPSPTSVPSPDASATPTPSSSATPVPDSSSPVPTPTSSPTSTPMPTPTPTPSITPTPDTVNIFGQVIGLDNGKITVTLNDANPIEINTEDNTFEFSGLIEEGESYTLAITDESGTTDTCQIINAMGTANDDVTDVLVSCPIFIAEEGPVKYHGDLHTDNAQIKGEQSDEQVVLNGLSLNWSNPGWPGDDWWNPTAWSTFADEWNIEMLRLPVGIETDGGLLENEANLYRVQDAIEWAIASDIYIVVDWHSGIANTQTQAAVDFFADIAFKYGEHDNVIFEIYNQPVGDTTWAEIKAYAETVTAAIREHSDNLVVVGTPNWSEQPGQVVGNEVNAENIAYSFIFKATEHGDDIWSSAETALDAGIPVFASAWQVGGVGDDASAEEQVQLDTQALTAWLERLTDRKLSWNYWSAVKGREGVFNDDGSLTTAGEFIFAALQNHADQATWRGNTPVDPDPELEMALIDNFNDENLENEWGGLTTVFLAAPEDSESTITATEDLIVVVEDNVPETHLRVDFDLVQHLTEGLDDDDNLILIPDEQYVGIVLNLLAETEANEKVAHDITGCEAISFKYKGVDTTLRMEQTDVVESGKYTYHQVAIPASDDWVMHEILLESFVQPDWADEDDEIFDRDLTQVEAFSWQIASDEDFEGYMAIDYIRCDGAQVPNTVAAD